jgi:hypothetical protein
MRWRGQHDHVNAACQDLFVGIETGEAALVFDVYLVLNRLIGFKLLQARLQTIGKRIAHRNQLHMRVRVQGLRGSSRSAAATTDETNLQNLVASNMHIPDCRRGAESRTSQDGARGLKKLPPRAAGYWPFG